ncbi:STAS domain-containing protein [Umezawaea tangerina]|uniref:Anti-anti-sigma factor n=1 Tax=Umezawaea tangerina TaxID=84725 RepID=A0A2T0SZ13_9PSEU|nr:STAS domain-containing protein [Umezawaea tangerina]PRY38656.1 anti-anti-sigma factor [Umezawaea tangerina]
MVVQSEDEFFVEVTHTPAAVLVTVTGDLDADTAPELDWHLERIDTGSGVVVLDLTSVSFCDSVGLASFLTVVRRGVDVRVVGSRQVVRLMALAGITDHVTLAASVAEAVPPDPGGRPRP